MKLFIKILFFTFLSFNLYGQIISNYGIKLGLGISNQTWSHQDFDYKYSISPRIFADFFNISFFQIETEVGYIKKGFNEKIPITTITQPDGTGEYITNNISLDYLTISALTKFKYEFELITPYMLIGPQFNILLGKDIQKGWEIIFNNYKSSNINITIGFGIEIKNIISIPIILEYKKETDLLDNYELAVPRIINYSHLILLGIKI